MASAPEHEVEFADWTESLAVDEELHRNSVRWAEREAAGDRLDARRDADLEAAGYKVMRITEEMVWGQPSGVGGTVRAAIRRLAG